MVCKVQLQIVWAKIFAKTFEINFENEKGENVMVWQNSWTCTTITLGLMVVLPPKAAALQAVVIPVSYQDTNTHMIFDACATTATLLNEAGIRADADLRDNCSHGWLKSHWDMKGVPLRIEIGPD